MGAPSSGMFVCCPQGSLHVVGWVQAGHAPPVPEASGGKAVLVPSHTRAPALSGPWVDVFRTVGAYAQLTASGAGMVTRACLLSQLT